MLACALRCMAAQVVALFLLFDHPSPTLDPLSFVRYKGSPIHQIFLSGIWRRFGHMSMERLDTITKETSAYKNAIKRGPRAEMTLKEMSVSFLESREAPAPSQVAKKKIFRTQSGRPVEVKAWVPGAK